MQQLLSVWSALDMRRRVIVALATVAMFAAVLGLSRMATAPSMALLYSGLESSAAGDVVQALEQRGVKYEVRGSSIYVDKSKRDELRMTLASAGLPANSTAGYELLDSLSGFGTTSQMFDAAYWRAKEGELARTIVSSPYIRAARVHIASPSSQPFQRQIKPTASVMVTTSAGTLSAAHAKALKYLVASAVAGLLPQDVAIIDTQGGLIDEGDKPGSGAQGGNGRAAALKSSVEHLLEAHVGAGNAVVEVNVETVTARESIVEHSFDPNSRVAISTDTQEQSTTSKDSGGGASVTVASNLPSGNAAAGRNASSQNSTTRERTNYEVADTKREILKLPGAIKRLTVAVLVNGVSVTNAAGVETITPRSAQELGELRDLVASAVGFQKERGDVITVKSLEFSPVAQLGTPATVSFMDGLNLDIMSIIQLVVLAVVALILGMFVVRPILNSAPTTAALPKPDALSDGDAFASPVAGSGPASLPPLTGEISNGDFLAPNMAVVSDFAMPDEMGAATSSGPEALPPLSADPVVRLRQMIEDRQEETVEILRGWMEDSEETV